MVHKFKLPPKWANWEVVYELPDEAIGHSKFFKTKSKAKEWAKKNEDNVIGLYKITTEIKQRTKKLRVGESKRYMENGKIIVVERIA